MFSGTIFLTVVFVLLSLAPLTVSVYSWIVLINHLGFPFTYSFVDFEKDIEDHQQ